MSEKEAIHQTHWNPSTPGSQNREINDPVYNHGKICFSELKTKQTIPNMEEIVNKLINHIKENR